MAQFDVYRYDGSEVSPFIIDIQHHLLNDLPTRLVVPLFHMRFAEHRYQKLDFEVMIEDTPYLFKGSRAGSMATPLAKFLICNLEADYRQQITDAVDFLLYGI